MHLSFGLMAIINEKLVEDVARMREKRNAYKILVGKHPEMPLGKWRTR
jgi:hypothetical protein